MTYLRKHVKLVTVAVACVAIGAAASAIATAGAASSTTSTTGTSSSSTAKAPRVRSAGARALERRAVQANVVVATRTGFANVTIERGFVQRVSGQQLTIREGTKSATYKTATLTIPSNAKVRDNRQASALSSLTAGQRVVVVQAPQRTWVVARTVATP
jgi:TolA-binding protein